MRRILLLVTVALMLAAAMALSGVAQAKPITNTKADARCLAEAAKTVDQPGFNPSNYTFHGGTEGTDFFPGDAEQPDVFCGFGGNDELNELFAGDIFLGGEGNDHVDENRGTIYGGEGIDFVADNEEGATFNGGAGDDRVSGNSGTFNGQEGNDFVDFNFGTFVGGEGCDAVGSGNGPVDPPESC
jgi:hypothetical protein